MWRLFLLVLVAAADDSLDGESSRKVLGSSVVTSVSVIMDAGNGTKIYADAAGKPVSKPLTAADLASPINLLNPDRYEFYTFDDAGDLVKRLMTLKEIQDIVATGDGDGLSVDPLVPEKRVNDVVNNVQSVLKEEMKTHKNPDEKPPLDTPDVSDTWSMILPAIFGNSGEDIKPERPITHGTPDTIIVTTQQIATTEKIMTLPPQKTTPTPKTTTEEMPTLDVEIITNSNLTENNNETRPVVEIKPAAAKITTTTQEMSTTTEQTLSTTVPKETTLTTQAEVLTTFATDALPEETTTIATTTTTTTTEPTSTFGALSTFFTIVDNKLTADDDLSTLSSEYVTTKTAATTTESQKEPTSTTESQSTTTNLLDQFLLSSTNIYEINSELSDVRQTTDGEESTTITTTTTEEPSTTTERFLIRMTDPTETTTTTTTATVATTTDQTFIDTIEQLISQAVGTPAPPVQLGKESIKIEEMMMGSANKTMPEVVKEAATLASNLVGVDAESTTVLTTTTDDSTTTVLSTTTVDYDTTTVTTEATTTEEPTTFVPHIINITIIRNENRTKPAKSDLSLEMDYLMHELEKNTTTEAPTTFSSTTDPKPSIVITINETNSTSPDGSTWTLVSTILPPNEVVEASTQLPVDLVPKPLQGFGLEDSTAKLDTDIYQFVQLCNELAFGFWKSVTSGISSARSVVVSPFAATSLLAMVFLGARGATSGEMNEILRLDDMVTFNPHLIFKNVSESIEVNPDSGVAVSAIIRELYSDRSKGKLLGFYKERVRQFYDGHVEEVSFREIGDVIRRRTNLLVKKSTDGKISEYLKDGSIFPKPPLAGISVSIFQTDCSQGSTEGRDGELHFVVFPSMRQRRLVPVPATVYRTGFLAGYEPSLDATAAALGTKDQTVSTVFVIPGQQGMAAPGDGLARLEKRLVESAFKKGAWARLLRSLIPRPGLELQIPRFQHRSLLNTTRSLKRMGLHDLFDSRKADLKGLNGAAHELHLSDVLQINEFATCGEGRVGEAHHQELYPAATDRKGRMLEEVWEEPRDYQRAFHDPLHDPRYLALPLPLRPRQARLPEAPRLRFDRPFLYFVRHNPSGLILHMGRFYPRLLP